VHWNEAFYSAANAAPLYAEGVKFGLADGVAIPMHGRGVKVAFVNFVFGSNASEQQSDIVQNLGNAHLLACYLHEAYQKFEIDIDVGSVDGKPLSKREIECLRWSADGKTSWEIAQILTRSERTIVFHLTNAAQKLGAVNRRQAVVRAIALGLIVP
jgi:DNA-binding CsgD family transcriptional regulator